MSRDNIVSDDAITIVSRYTMVPIIKIKVIVIKVPVM